MDNYSNFIEFTELFVLYLFIDVKMGSSSFSVHPVLHQWCFQASKNNMAEMTWLAFVLVASSVPDGTMTDHILIQRRLLQHCNGISFLLRETIPKAPCNEAESLLDGACHPVRNLYQDQGKLREAEDMYVRALAGSEKASGPEHNKTVMVQRNMANLKTSRRGKSRLFKKNKT